MQDERTAADRIDASALAAWSRHLPGDVAAGAGAGDPVVLRRWLAAGTLAGAAAASADSVGDRCAFVIDGRPMSHAGLSALAASVAARLGDLGVVRGDRVLLCVTPSLDFVVAYLAMLRSGVVTVLANPAYTRTELAHQVQVAGARVALTDASTEQTVAATGVPTLSLADVVADAAAYEPVPMAQLSGDDIAVLAFTSGTTGRAKGVPLTHANLLSSARAIGQAWRFSADEVIGHALPLFHQHGLGTLHLTFLYGCTTHIRSRFEAGPLIDLLLDNAATALFAVPAMHQRLVGHPRVGELAGLRLVISGSAPLSAELCERLATELGQPPVERYGLTESGLDVSNPYDGPRVPGTVGYPLPGVEVRLAASDTTAEPSEQTTEGEITLRGPQIFTGYWQDDSATDAAFLPGGWFRTGDLGRRDDDGRLTISGRLKELIISGGFNVMPAEVEQCLEQHDDVAEAAVAGVPSERWGEEVTAWVVPVGDSVDIDGLLALARGQLAPYKVPKRVLCVDSLPRNAMGKIVRSELSVEDH